MTKEEISKWNDRHFQICMQFLKGFSSCSNGLMNKLDMEVIIIKANRMIELLQQREAKMAANDETVSK